MFEGQPKGLFALALANTGERFGYYTMLAVFVLFLQDNFGWSAALAGSYYSTFLMFVYFLPFIGGILADKFGYGRMVTIGISIMFLGYLLLSFPLGNGTPAVIAIIGALALICMGTGLFKGNLQVMVGDLYKSPELAGKRDAAFSIFYMAINIGALFAPSAAVKIMEYAQNIGFSKADSYHFAFAVACVSLIISMLIYFASRSTFRHVEGKQEKADSTEENKAKEETVELSPADTRARIVALCLVFAVVIFFWMAFHQNGLTMTFFARDYTAKSVVGFNRLGFDILNLVLIVVSVYSAFSLFQSKTSKGKTIAGLVLLAAIGGIVANYSSLDAEIKILPQIFQQFNPFFVVALTPVSLAVFGYLARKGKEPSAPRKIGYGMLIAACGFLVLAIASFGLPTPNEVKNSGISDSQLVSPDWLISTYLVLTFAELLLSPMGISFVSKVAPPKYKGMMMGGWFVATAIGNYLVAVIGYLWGDMQLWMVWSVLITCCLISALFIFSIIKRLEKVC